jgi:hypothetical protein
MHGNLAKPISLQEIAATLLVSARFISHAGSNGRPGCRYTST